MAATTEGRGFEGPWPFITRVSTLRAGRHVVWRARQHRKGLGATAPATDAAGLPVWRRPAYNWITGACFAAGSMLFMLGSLLLLVPDAIAPSELVTLNGLFFLGSIPFTVAGFLQNFQAANAPAFGRRRKPAGVRIALIGWKPNDLGWLSTFAQLIGTVAFNVSTFDAIQSPARAIGARRISRSGRRV